MKTAHEDNWWSSLDALVAGAAIVVDRPAGTPHPRFPERVYPRDYGHLRGTVSGDGAEVDVWLGDSRESCVVAAAICVDQLKHDLEVKLLLGCSEVEISLIRDFLSHGSQAVYMIARKSADAR